MQFLWVPVSSVASNWNEKFIYQLDLIWKLDLPVVKQA